MNKDNFLLDKLREGDQETLEKIYLEFKADFFAFAGKINADREVLLDVYQDSIIALYENVQNGNLTSLKSTLKTYLFSIGKFKLYKINKEEHRFANDLPEELYHVNEGPGLFDEDVSEERIERIGEAIEKLGKKCREMLVLFYFRGFDLEEIRDEMSLENKNTAKSQKSRCISHLKKLINQEQSSQP